MKSLMVLQIISRNRNSEYRMAPPEPETLAAPHHDPLSTGTLAELYVTQGFIHKALEIYRAILVDNPADRATAERVVELEALEAGSSEPDAGIDDTFVEEAGDEDAFGISSEELLQSTVPSALSDSDGLAEVESQKSETILAHERQRCCRATAGRCRQCACYS